MVMEQHEMNLFMEVGWSIADNTAEAVRPSALFNPRVFRDEGAWCVLLGDNIQEGVCGFGPSPEAACRDFDSDWYNCIDTTCGSGSCSRCSKAKEVETVLEAKDGDGGQR